MNIKKAISAILLTISLSSCASHINVKTTDINTKIEAPKPEPLSLSYLNWIVINKNNYINFFKNNPNINLFSLSSNDFENYANNMQNIKQFMLEQKQVIQFYKKVTSPTSKDSSK